MKLAAQIERIATGQRMTLAVAMVMSIAPVLALQGQAMPPVPDTKAAPAIVTNTGASATATAAPRLREVRSAMFREGTRQGVTLSLDVAGEFSYVPGNSGPRLLTLDLPGVATAEPPTSHLLQSTLVSSYRVVAFQRDGQSSTRLEVLLKSAASADYSRSERGLEIHLLPASAASQPAALLPVSAAAGRPAARANRLEKVQLSRGAASTSVEVMANGSVEFKAFELQNPHRLVVDLPDLVSQVSKQPITGQAPLRGVRVGQFKENPPIARVVLELDETARYDVRRGEKGLAIEVRSVNAPARLEQKIEPKKETVVADATPAAPVMALPAPVQSKVSETMPASSDAVFASMRQPVASPRPETKPASEPAVTTPMLMPRANAKSAETPASAAPAQTPGPSQAMASVIPMAVAAPSQAPVVPMAAPKPMGMQAPGSMMLQNPISGKRYTGEPISINVKAVDLLDFFRLIQEISGLNVIVDQSVRGSLTMVLTDVPWDQALDIVLRNFQLDSVLEGNVLRIATVAQIQAEQKSAADIVAAQQDLVERVNVTRTVNYAKAAELAGTIKAFLTKRGTLIADDRTNQLIITDVPSGIAAADEVLKQLDRRTQQVEIEARVVSASRQFVRELGAQVGMNWLAGRTAIGGNPVGGNLSPIIRTGNVIPSPLIGGGGAIPLFSNFPAAGANTGIQLFTGKNGLFDLDIILTAAESKGTGKLLSRPRIITQNNRPGKVQQGVQIPIQTTVNNTVSVIFQPVTLAMDVTPQITGDGMIFLDINVTNSTIDPGIPRINGTPALDTQQATTRVLVPDGGTVVFGGVIQNQNNLTIQQVPLLGSVPILGNLFKRTGISTTTSELLFFVSPKII